MHWNTHEYTYTPLWMYHSKGNNMDNSHNSGKHNSENAETTATTTAQTSNHKQGTKTTVTPAATTNECVLIFSCCRAGYKENIGQYQ